jgi:hypothetical protein
MARAFRPRPTPASTVRAVPEYVASSLCSPHVFGEMLALHAHCLNKCHSHPNRQIVVAGKEHPASAMLMLSSSLSWGEGVERVACWVSLGD